MPLEDAEQGQPTPEPGRTPNTRRVTDVATMRALSHPVRIALLEELWMGGALTATELGERIGETPTTCSFHLRQLAKYGWVEEAGGGKGRARPWRMTTVGFETPSSPDNPEAAIANTALVSMFRERQIDRYRAWVQTRSAAPREWREASTDSQFGYYLTAGELKQLGKELNGLLTRWFSEERITDPAQRPPGSVPVEVLALAHPLQFPAGGGVTGAGNTGPAAEAPGQDEGPAGDPE
jgi:DNA-binding transcriptional ArsR family regulator